MRNTLFDSNLGDVDSINVPIGQTTPFSGVFTTVQASVAIFGTVQATTEVFPTNISVSGTVHAANVAASSTVSAANVAASTVAATNATIATVSATNAVVATVAASNVTVTGQVTASNISVGPVQASQVSASSFLAPVATSINLTTATSGFAAALALTAAINVVVSVSYTSGGPVALPSVGPIVGASVVVFNQSTHSVAVWPQAVDAIDALGTTVAIIMNAGQRAAFYGIAAPNATTSLGQWISAQLGTTAV